MLYGHTFAPSFFACFSSRKYPKIARGLQLPKYHNFFRVDRFWYGANPDGPLLSDNHYPVLALMPPQTIDL